MNIWIFCGNMGLNLMRGICGDLRDSVAPLGLCFRIRSIPGVSEANPGLFTKAPAGAVYLLHPGLFTNAPPERSIPLNEILT